MVPAFSETEEAVPSSRRRSQLVVVLAVAMITSILFYLGWVLPSVGGSLSIQR